MELFKQHYEHFRHALKIASAQYNIAYVYIFHQNLKEVERQDN